MRLQRPAKRLGWPGALRLLLILLAVLALHPRIPAWMRHDPPRPREISARLSGTGRGSWVDGPLTRLGRKGGSKELVLNSRRSV